MARRKRLTPLQEAFKKQIKRLKSAVKRIEKRGYEVDFKVPEMPKRVTKKALTDISTITTRKIYRESSYINPNTGEILSGVEGRKLERQESARKAQRTRESKKVTQPTPQESVQARDTTFSDIVISNYKSEAAKFNTPLYNVLMDLVNSLIAEHGEEAVAIMLQDAAEAGIQITWQVMYKQEAFGEYTHELIEYLPQAGNLTKDEWRQRVDDTIEWYTYSE